MIGFTCGTFDLLHAGHILMLEECKRQCDHLVVGLKVNPQADRPTKNKPVQSIVERQIQLRGCQYVDDVIVYETEEDLVEILKTLDIDIRFIGADYMDRQKDITGRELCKFVFTRRDHDYSTTNLRKRVEKARRKE